MCQSSYVRDDRGDARITPGWFGAVTRQQRGDRCQQSV